MALTAGFNLTRRGAAMGPTALRIAGVDLTLSDLGHEVTDEGDLRPLPARGAPGLDAPSRIEAWDYAQLQAIPREATVCITAATPGPRRILAGT